MALLALDRVLIGICQTQLMGNPLIMDYIKKDSRGKAAALQSLGLLFGEAFAIAVLFGISKRASFTQAESFAISALIVVCLGCLLYCAVRDVDLKQSTSIETNASAD